MRSTISKPPALASHRPAGIGNGIESGIHRYTRGEQAEVRCFLAGVAFRWTKHDDRQAHARNGCCPDQM